MNYCYKEEIKTFSVHDILTKTPLLKFGFGVSFS